MSKPFRPLLAATIEDNETLDRLAYPLIASPKVDGIRIICHHELGPITRSSKPVRNEHVMKHLKSPWLQGFDGEIVSGPIAAQDVFNKTTTAVMSYGGTPDFMYHVFDYMMDTEYSQRLSAAEHRVALCRDAGIDCVRALPWRVVLNPQDVLDAEIDWLAHGFEGVMLRYPQGRYKQGRSTLKEQILMKLKRFKDAEAVIEGFEPLYSNQNPQTRNSQGLAERSDHKAGKVQIETLGNLIVRDLSGRFSTFNVGSGFDSSTRDLIWSNRNRYLGRVITYKFQEVGILEAPRFPIFLRFREAE